jgi:hypothetical protein
LVLAKVTTAPFAGAAPFNVTVPVELAAPPTTAVGFSTTDVTAVAAGETVSGAVAFVALNVAVIVGVTAAATALVVTVNCAVVAPANTVTLTGTAAAAALVLAKVTTAPFAGAGPFNVTVPVELAAPPITAVGFSTTDVTAVAGGTGGFTVNVAAAVPFNADEAVIVTMVCAATARLVTGKVAVVAFASTVTGPVTVAADGVPLIRVTEIPPAGAGPLRVTVPVTGAAPPTTVGGLRVTDRIDGGPTVSADVNVPL